MDISLDLFANSISLEQSVLFGNIYEKTIPNPVSTFNTLSIKNLADWYGSVTHHYPFMNELQRENFARFTEKLEQHLKEIDPRKIKINVDSIQEDESLVLWRESQKGVAKMIFNPYGVVSLVFLGYDGKKSRCSKEGDFDFEGFLYHFMSM